MSRARGRSEIAKKERNYLRRHPGTLNGTLKYMAEQRSLKKRAKKSKQEKKEPDWIDNLMMQIHEEEKSAQREGNPD